MAIYHCSVKAISRSAGRSAMAAAAYRSAGRIEDERQGMIHDYTRKGGVVVSGCGCQGSAPPEMGRGLGEVLEVTHHVADI
jgi:hypothetical protein